MKVLVVCVGKAKGPLAAAIGEYEDRLRHYYSFETREVREESARRGLDLARVKDEEGKRLIAAVPTGARIVALDPGGATWSSERLSRYLGELALGAASGVAFLIGGAYGLSDAVLQAAHVRLSLSAFTLPHELARLVLTEQLYRAGTIARGEPYHK